MLGIKAGSVNFPLRKICFGKKQLTIIRLSALFSPVTCRCRPDKVRQSICGIGIGKITNNVSGCQFYFSPWISSQIIAIPSLF